MRLQCAYGRRRATTLIELLCASAIMAMVASVTVARLHVRAVGERARCAHNLKETALAFRLFANDNADRFPMHVPEAFGGSRAASARGDVVAVLAALAAYELQPAHLVCPADSRTVATALDNISAANLSYFVNLDARAGQPAAVLLGDRDLIAARTLQPLEPISGSHRIPWRSELHSDGGNIALVDGSARWENPTANPEALAAMAAAGRLVAPHADHR